jgi:RHS repeat-associated protein
VDNTGAVVGYDDYDPWGYILPGRSMATGGSTVAGAAKNKFTGKEWDDEFGVNWNYFGARYYDPQIGRWMVRDPLEEFPSPYVYVGNNPVRFTDLFGLASTDTLGSEKNPIPFPEVVVEANRERATTLQRPGILPGGFAAFLVSRVLGELTPVNENIRERLEIDPFTMGPHEPNPNKIAMMPTIAPGIRIPTGLKNASQGLQLLFSGGSIKGKSIIDIRTQLVKNGFKQTVTRNGQGYLFRNSTGEAVRVMSRDGKWDIRVQNQFGNYLDEFGNVGSPASTHNIEVFSK